MDSPALTSRTFVRSIITAWSTFLPDIVAATSLTLLGELSETCPPIIRKGVTSATGLNPLLANVDLPSLTVSKSTNGAMLLGDVVIVLDWEFLTILLITFLLIRAGSLLTMTLPAEAEADADAPPEADEDEEAPLD